MVDTLIQATAALNLLLCALYAGVYLLGRRPFALCLSIYWGTSWIAAILGAEISVGAFLFTLEAIAIISSYLAVYFLQRRTFLALSSASVIAAIVMWNNLTVNRAYAVAIGLSTTLIGAYLLLQPPSDVLKKLLGPPRHEEKREGPHTPNNLVSLFQHSMPSIFIAMTFLLYGILNLAWFIFGWFTTTYRPELFVAGMLIRGAHLVALAVLLAFWFQKVHEILRQESVFEEVSTLAAAIEHEVRSPLSILRQCTELLRRSRNPESNMRQLARIEDQLQRINAAIDILPSFSRARHIGTNVNLEVIVEKGVELALSETGVSHRDAQGIIRIGYPEEVALVSANQSQLVQVVSNLVRNALEAVAHLEAMGFVHVTIEIEEKQRKALLTIRDNGLGIDPAFLPRLGEPYLTSKSGAERARGLGLFVATRLARFNKGKLSFDSDGKSYTLAKLVLPIAEVLPPTIRKKSRRFQGKGSPLNKSSRKISRGSKGGRSADFFATSAPSKGLDYCVLIDDDVTFSQSMHEWIEDASGFKVLTMSNFDDITAWMDMKEVKVVVVDHHLGLSVTGEQWLLDNLEKLRGKQLVLLTGYTRSLEHVSQLEAAGVEILEKGEDEKKLHDLLRRLKRRKRPV